MLLSSILPNVASLNPTHPALKYKNETLTYEQLLRQASSVAHGFRELGVRPGDRVALLSHPSPLLVVAEIAAVAIGAIPFAIFPRLTSSDIAHILQDADPVAVVYDSSDLKLSECVSLLVNTSVTVNAIPCKASHHAPSPSIESFIATCPPLGQWHEANPDDVALLIYTGGTTGRSKGVMHSHRTIRSWSFMNPERGGGHLSSKKMILPNQAHLTGQFILWTTLFEGGCLIFPESYPLQAEEVIALIEREQLKNVGTVGLLFKDIVDLKNLSPGCARSVEGISCGGAPISENTFRAARDIFPNAYLTEVYSQTESGQFISYLSINQCFAEGKLNRLLSVGKPSDVAVWGQKPFQVRIVDESGNDVPQGHTGEIICQGDQMMLGY
ncbi:hypothetical protein D7Z26_22365 [Cohnella endophytica]|uniref:AMP-dependent synthetase/ligase domain-containing protein n=1 Tax=Cohnella endophytica TaxID=2419778 RepID=A0A494XB24_9BACL|nr:long-chain fatty acid--CoA ligase [Cohnella endophytica]RKP47955.1 hypothetical protein D7Z26_22365 [Cohnella endophytica]